MKRAKTPTARRPKLSAYDEIILASWSTLSYDQQQVARGRLSAAGKRELARREDARQSSSLDTLIDFLESNARMIADDWVMDGTSFEQDQYTRQAALSMTTAALHLRSLRSSLRHDEQARRARAKRRE